MTILENAQKVVNANDNLQLSWVTRYPEYASHVPLANLLIQKHCSERWKNHPQSYDYQMAHFSLCMELSGSRGSREWTCRFLAIYLKCNPFVLMNDTSPELKDIQ